MIRLLKKALRGFRREDGAASVEFAYIFLPLMTVFTTGAESGVLLARNAMLDRALDLTVRDLRLGTWPTPTHDIVKAAICERMMLMGNCLNDLKLELRPVDTNTWAGLSGNVDCVNRDEPLNPPLAFTPGASNEIMLVRACAIFDPVMPTLGLGETLVKDNPTGGYRITAISAFVNEPR